MANAVFPLYKTALLLAAANVSLNQSAPADAPFVQLHDVGDIGYNPAFDNLDDVDAARVGTAMQIANATVGVVSAGTFDGDNVTFASVIGDPCEAVVFYRNNAGTPDTKKLFLWLDANITGLPVTPNGGNITLTWSASGIFTLGDNMTEDLQPKDPLRHVPDNQRELFVKLTRECEGFSMLEVRGAASNLIVNAIRQLHPTRDAAEQAFNEMFGKAKQLLMEHYDITGRKKGIFPFDQVLHVPHQDFRNQAVIMGRQAERPKR